MSVRNTYDLKGKVIFITGVSTGIGRATALACAKNGARIAAFDINAVEGQKLVDEIKSFDGQAFFSACDVSQENEVKQAVERTIATYGRIDSAFNNAGIEGAQAPTHETSSDNWDKVINTNLKGVWLCMKYQIPHMLTQGSGVIVNCSSIAGLIGFQNIPAYTASKHGVIGLTQTAALEYAKAGIRVNALCPGVIDTPMVSRFTHGEKTAQRQLESGEPIGRMGTPDEMAGAVLWLLSPDSSFVTGHALTADGGWVAQ